ncbi:hypothetical protein [Marinagarivorans cellulosilyticus]|uniref:Transcriptional regulator SutA RNAP-binding domain-containing protein n=1 Tax=Marinagarivorans cellulosilyticus TaxID=2721545 RepID=A0AAN1WGZ3_9GAMM|nr:hypothetical protein [Marinagarivorans cellulosilyticus]BCD97418.1 hypothetical protein MARGE09_P1619 [Marinagarivorans cellulosilyticus]
MSDEYDDVLDNDASSDTVSSDMEAVNSIESSDAERERARLQLEADIEAFLANGGQIQSVDVNVMADPPKRPQSNYGGQPI